MTSHAFSRASFVEKADVPPCPKKNILKRNEFTVIEGVNTDELSQFVNLMELSVTFTGKKKSYFDDE
jgi:hypothetical protein